MAIFEVELDIGAAGTPLRAQRLHQQLRDAIVSGQLKPGARVPASRKSAALFGLARTTVVGVYNQLLDEGLLVSRHGSGTYVAARAASPATLGASGAAAREDRLNPFWLKPEVTSAFGFFDDGTAIVPDSAAYPTIFDFRPGLVDLKHFPFDVLRRVSAQKMRAFEQAPFNYGHPQGNPDLRAPAAAKGMRVGA